LPRRSLPFGQCRRLSSTTRTDEQTKGLANGANPANQGHSTYQGHRRGKLVWKEKTKYLPFPIFDEELQNAIAVFGARKAYELMYDQFKIVEQAPIRKEIEQEYAEKTDGNGGSKNRAAKREELEALGMGK